MRMQRSYEVFDFFAVIAFSNETEVVTSSNKRRRDGNVWMRGVVADEGMPDDVAVNSIVSRLFCRRRR